MTVLRWRSACLALGLAAGLVMAVPAAAVGVDADQLADPAMEAEARAIMKDLRCLVCQNQSIEDSNADLARDLRAVVREHVAAGEDARQIRAYLVARYGDWILLKPPFEGATLMLWIAPAVLLGIGGVLAWRAMQRSAARLVTDDTDDEDTSADAAAGGKSMHARKASPSRGRA